MSYHHKVYISLKFSFFMDESSRISLLSQLEQALQDDKPLFVSRASEQLLQDETSRDIVVPVVLAYDLLKSTGSAFSTHRTSLAIIIGLHARGKNLPTSSRDNLIQLVRAGTENIAYKAANQVVDDNELASLAERLSDRAVKLFMNNQRNPQTQFFRKAINFAQIYVDGIDVLVTRYPKTSALAIDAFVYGACGIPDADFRFPILSQNQLPHGRSNVPNHNHLTDIGKLAVAARAQQLRRQGFGQDQLNDEKAGLPGYLDKGIKKYLKGEAGSAESRAKVAHAFMLLSDELSEQEFMGIGWVSYNIPRYFAGYVHSASSKNALTPEKIEHLQRVFAHSAEAFGYGTNSPAWNNFREAFEDKLSVQIENAYSVAIIGGRTSPETRHQLRAINNMLAVAGNLIAPNIELNRKIHADTKMRFTYWASEGDTIAQKVCHLLCLPYTAI